MLTRMQTRNPTLKCARDNSGDEFVRPGKFRNPVAVLFERPTEAAVELGRALTGRTEVNLCRVFERLKFIDAIRYKNFCSKDVLVWNTYADANKRVQDDGGCHALNFRRRSIKTKRYVFCFGFAAHETYREIAGGDKLWGSNKVVVQLCHLGDRGVQNVFKWHDPKGKLVLNEKLDIIAMYIDECCKKGGFFSISDFERGVEKIMRLNALT